MAAPAVSVLIIVHNRAHTIGAAVRSVLGQTLTDFELVVVDDGSTDTTTEVVDGFDDPRLRLVRTRPNQGIPLARNRALAEATGKYIAWLDSDDLCHPERLKVQFNHLERHPRTAMIGSAARKIRADGTLMRAARVPVRCHEQIRALLLFRSAFQQSSIFGRAEAIRAVPYDPAFPVCEDVDMFVRFTERFHSENLPHFLIARRIHPGQTIRSNVERIIDRQMAISGRQLARLGLNHDQDELRRHVVLSRSFGDQMSDDLIHWSNGWFERLIAANRRQHIYDEAALRFCFDTLLLKAAARGIRDQPSRAGRLLGLFALHPQRTAALAWNFVAPVLPFASRPAAGGINRVTKA